MSAPCLALGLLFTQLLRENLSCAIPCDVLFALGSVAVGDAGRERSEPRACPFTVHLSGVVASPMVLVLRQS